MATRPKEKHRTQHIGWLRAAVLGANDGIVSTASLIVGVAAAQATRSEVLLAGVAGLVAGAMSMAAGEYVSVSSQSDTEQADLDRERAAIAGSIGQALAGYSRGGCLVSVGIGFIGAFWVSGWLGSLAYPSFLLSASGARHFQSSGQSLALLCWP